MRTSLLPRDSASTLTLLTRLLLAAFAGGLSFLAALAVFLLAVRLVFSDRALPGVRSGEVALSGKTATQIAEAVAAAYTYPQTGLVALRDGAAVWMATPAELGVRIDGAASARLAASSAAILKASTASLAALSAPSACRAAASAASVAALAVSSARAAASAAARVAVSAAVSPAFRAASLISAATPDALMAAAAASLADLEASSARLAASMAALTVLPVLISSRIRSKIRMFESTEIPMVRMIPAIPGRVRVNPSQERMAIWNIVFSTRPAPAMTPASR